MRFLHDGLEFDVATGGPLGGPEVLLLHGFPGGPDTWQTIAPMLHAVGCRTWALTQRGYSVGSRANSVGDYAVERLVADAVATIGQIGRPVQVIGHDWGGAVAWCLAAARPDLVEGMVVLSTPHPRAFVRSLIRSSQAVRSAYAVLFQLPVVPEALLLAGTPSLLEQALRSSGLDDSTAARYADQMGEPGRLTAALNWYRAAARFPAGLRRVAAVDVPTTYVWGSGDTALGRRAAEDSRRWMAGSHRFAVIEGATHWLPEQHLSDVWPIVSDHLHRYGGGRTSRRPRPFSVA